MEDSKEPGQFSQLSLNDKGEPGQKVEIGETEGELGETGGEGEGQESQEGQEGQEGEAEECKEHKHQKEGESATATTSGTGTESSKQLFNIHGIDQRSKYVVFKHEALGDREVRVEQYGAGDPRRKHTATVVWISSFALATYLCDATVKHGSSKLSIQEKLLKGAIPKDAIVVEVGAGLGLLGLTCATLGARKVIMTDMDAELLADNAKKASLKNAMGLPLLWSRSDKAVAADEESDKKELEEEEIDRKKSRLQLEEVKKNLPDRLPHLILASDVVFMSKVEIEALVDTIAALSAPDTITLLAFEDREMPEVLMYLWDALEAAGMGGTTEELDPAEGHDAELLLFKLQKKA